jgi:hypothetical protein
LPGQDFESCASASSATSAISVGLSAFLARLSIAPSKILGYTPPCLLYP